MRQIALALLGICFLASASSAQRLTDGQLLDRAASAVVSLVVRNDKGEEVNSGTGFIVSSEGHVLTVAHVRPGSGEYLEGIVGAKDGTRLRLSPMGLDEARDVALWQLPQAVGCRPALGLSVDRPAVSEELMGLGFPQGLGMTPISLKLANLFGPSGTMIVDGYLSRGTSGGPVLNRAGLVVGIIRGGHPSSASENHVTPITMASGLLQTVGRWPPRANQETYPIECYRPCAHPSHGIERYGTEVPWAANSGWLGGGNSRPNICGGLRAGWEASNPGQTIEIPDSGMTEDSKKDVFGHVEYMYFCRGTARSNPVYREARSRACGLIGATPN